MSFSLSFFQTPEKKKSADKQNGSPDKKAGTSGKPQNQVICLKVFTLKKRKRHCWINVGGATKIFKSVMLWDILFYGNGLILQYSHLFWQVQVLMYIQRHFTVIQYIPYCTDTLQDKFIWVRSRLGFRFWYSVHIPFPNCQAVPTKSQGLPLDARGNSYQTSRCSLERRRHGSLTEKTTG